MHRRSSWWRYTHHFFRIMLITCVTLGCHKEARESRESEPRHPRVFVAHRALEYFARRIAGEEIDIWFPVPPSVDPSTWRPPRETLAQIQQCRLILLDVPGYSPWVATSSLPLTRVVDTTAPFAGRRIRIKHAVTHRHGPGGEHTHAGFAHGAWLDPNLARLQAEAVYEALRDAFPEDGDAMARRWERLRKDIETWRKEFDELAEGTRGTPLLASHPLYDYLARRGGWPIASVHWEPSEMPSESEWAKFDELRKQTQATIMLWEDEPIRPIRQRLEERGVDIVVYRLLDRAAGDEDWLEQMRANVRRLAKALGENAAGASQASK